MPKYIFVTGGVVSSLGKGLAASSIGCLLEARGLKVTLMKLDPDEMVATIGAFEAVTRSLETNERVRVADL